MMHQNVKLLIDGKEIPVENFSMSDIEREDIPDFGDFVSDNFAKDGVISFELPDFPCDHHKALLETLKELERKAKALKPVITKQPFFRKVEHGRNRWGRNDEMY